MGDAIASAKRLNQRGIRATLDLLGENVTEREAADAFSSAYVSLLRGIADAGVDANISVKLTMLGLDIDMELTHNHLVTILDAARETDNWVRIDMEGSRYTQLTLEAFDRVFESHDNVGVVIQAMMRRSERDIQKLISMGARVRLCKGAYKEPHQLAFEEIWEVNQSFDRLAEKLLVNGHDPAMATHDDARIEHVKAYAREQGIEPDKFEFQMLYGVRRETQQAVVEQGYQMRVYIPYGKLWLPYFMRRLRERKENVRFVLGNFLKH